jgi:hypothetical protein
MRHVGTRWATLRAAGLESAGTGFGSPVRTSARSAQMDHSHRPDFVVHLMERSVPTDMKMTQVRRTERRSYARAGISAQAIEPIHEIGKPVGIITGESCRCVERCFAPADLVRLTHRSAARQPEPFPNLGVRYGHEGGSRTFSWAMSMTSKPPASRS